MWKRAIRWLLIAAAAMFGAGISLQLAKPLFSEPWFARVMTVTAGLKLGVGIALLLALGLALLKFLFPQTGPYVMDQGFRLRLVIVIGVANFLAFVLVAGAIGGDALNGYIDHGHYFLRNHDLVTEVSRSVFVYSKWHSISTFVTHPLAIVAAWMLYFGQRGN
jgi:hypothetical protein